MTGNRHLEAVASENGQSTFAVTISTGDHQFVGDEPEQAGGADLGPSPYQLLASALAECTAMTVRWYARREQWPVDQVEVGVRWTREQAKGGAEVVDVFEKTVGIRGDLLSDVQREKLHDVAARCPVHQTLSKGSVIRTQAVARRHAK